MTAARGSRNVPALPVGCIPVSCRYYIRVSSGGVCAPCPYAIHTTYSWHLPTGYEHVSVYAYTKTVWVRHTTRHTAYMLTLRYRNMATVEVHSVSRGVPALMMYVRNSLRLGQHQCQF